MKRILSIAILLVVLTNITSADERIVTVGDRVVGDLFLFFIIHDQNNEEESKIILYEKMVTHEDNGESYPQHHSQSSFGLSPQIELKLGQVAAQGTKVSELVKINGSIIRQQCDAVLTIKFVGIEGYNKVRLKITTEKI